MNVMLTIIFFILELIFKYKLFTIYNHAYGTNKYCRKIMKDTNNKQKKNNSKKSNADNIAFILYSNMNSTLHMKINILSYKVKHKQDTYTYKIGIMNVHIN